MNGKINGANPPTTHRMSALAPEVEAAADLTWSGATSTNVDIYRNGVVITVTANDGTHLDNINNRGGGSYTYKVLRGGNVNLLE